MIQLSTSPIPDQQQVYRLPAISEEKVGLIAGWGNFPIEVAQKCQQLGCKLYVAAIKDHASSQLESLATELRWFGVAKLGGHMSFFERHGVRKVTLAGKLFKDRILFHGFGWMQHFPDIQCLRTLYPSFITRSRDTRDDTILGAIVQAYSQRGMEVVAAIDIAPQLMAQLGNLTYREPSRRERLDLEFGWKIAQQMGGLDIGQSITVRDQTVLGVEAVEGTDALISRTAQLCPRGGFTLVKVAKPAQDMRFDVPTIGLQTVQTLHRAGGTAIAIEAERTILVDRQATIDYANAHGIAIIAL